MKSRLVTIALILFSQTTLGEVDISGNFDFEWNLYPDDGQFAQQDYQSNFSLALEPEFYWETESGNHSVNFVPFARIDEKDDERSHSDIRELLWTGIYGNWETRVGIGKVFWGVTEFNHLVDIINQTDSVESADGEQKLGQPMISTSVVTDSGIFDLYLLPGFRERTFQGIEGRLRPGLVVNDAATTYESGRGQQHLDAAIRWSHSFDVYDLGIYYFTGTDRNPSLQAQGSQLVPHYQQIDQWGIDLQATIDSWLWKLETIIQDNSSDNFVAAQAGFEYTLYGIAGGGATDLGLLLEYGRDSRGKLSSSSTQNDLFLGSRFAFNDSQDTSLLIGTSIDQDYQSKTFIVEGSRRLNDYWTVTVNGNFFDMSNNDPVAFLDKDDRVQVSLKRFF